jgi:FMN phosphatase YigB (HAD superfamily)
MKPTVAIDFDGTLHPYTNGWQGHPGAVDTEPPDPEWRSALAQLARQYRLVVFSARAQSEEGRDAIRAWLRYYGLNYFADVTAVKPAAIAYLDDRAVHFDGEVRNAVALITAFDFATMPKPKEA